MMFLLCAHCLMILEVWYLISSVFTVILGCLAYLAYSVVCTACEAVDYIPDLSTKI